MTDERTEMLQDELRQEAEKTEDWREWWPDPNEMSQQ